MPNLKRQNLKRHKAITLRMTPEEYDRVHKKIATAKKKNQTDFFLALLDRKPIIVIEDLRPMLQELKRHGNNLNQIARKLNESGNNGDVAFRIIEGATRLMNECWKAYRTIANLEGVVRDAVIQRNSRQGQVKEND